jgi:pimeloyl-ACP methyl ester carboxylesterase
VTAHRVILLPGAVLQAEQAYGNLLAVLGRDVQAVAKDLELYSRADPATEGAGRHYTLDEEVDGVLRVADARGWSEFHLVGYSAGGAASLAVTATHPDRLLSLALLEPAWAGDWEWTAEHREFWAAQKRINELPQEQFLPAFMRLAVAPEVMLPSPAVGEPPPWMAQRPAGIRALTRAFDTFALDRAALAGFTRPVYFALGGLSNSRQYGEIAARLERVFRSFTLEVFPDRHHFDPPHRAEPQVLAASLLTTWDSAAEPETQVRT